MNTRKVPWTLFDPDFFSQLEGLRAWVRRPVWGRPWGEARGRRTGQSGEFADHRRYVPGDDIRAIDWPAYWRLRRAYVKVAQSHEDWPVRVLLDSSRSMGFGTPLRWNYARRLAAAFAFAMLRQGDPVWLGTFAESVETLGTQVRRTSQFHTLCGHLEDARIRGHGSVAQAAAAVPDLFPGCGLAVLISDFYSRETLAPAMGRLAAAHHDTLLIQVATPWEVRPDLSGEWELEDSETGDVVRLTATSGALTAHTQDLHRFSRQLQTLALQHGLLYLFTTTDRPEISVVREALEFLRR